MSCNIPVLFVQEKTLAQAYEKAILLLYEKGCKIKTQYDKIGDPLSFDSTMNITVLEPWSDPMIHKAFPGGIDDLKEYSMELMGVKDHWVKNMNDPDDTRWEYTYHQRLEKYGTWKMHDAEYKLGFYFAGLKDGQGINQIEKVIEKLCKQPFTRQAQMITWMPNLDYECYDPPCMQSAWYRILEDDKGIWWLNCNIRFRSNDAWGAYFMNMFGFTQFNRLAIADQISKRTGKQVEIGRLNWQADSWHIYGKDLKDAKERLIDRIQETSFEERTFNFHDDFIQEMYNGSESIILNKIREYDETH